MKYTMERNYKSMSRNKNAVRPRDFEIGEYLVNHSKEEASKHFNLNIETIGRCHRRFRKHLRDKERKTDPGTPVIPKVLLFDIETLPMEAFTWTLFKPMLNHGNIIKDWCCVSWSAKWLFEDKMMSDVLTPKEALKRDDKRIMQSLWVLLDQANIIIAHNSVKFDVPRSNTRFFLNGLKPPSPYQIIDTLKIAKREFRFSSNRLNYMGILIARKGKLETNFDLWKKCVNGDAEALEYMVKYNEEDVFLLEEVYNEMKPWMHSHPNLAVYSEATDSRCPVCLSTNIQTYGEYVTMVGRYDAIRCNDCGAPSRRRQTNLSKKQREVLLVSTAR
jgi:proteasome lid subunit RPN8/RPN11